MNNYFQTDKAKSRLNVEKATAQAQLSANEGNMITQQISTDKHTHTHTQHTQHTQNTRTRFSPAAWTLSWQLHKLLKTR